MPEVLGDVTGGEARLIERRGHRLPEAVKRVARQLQALPRGLPFVRRVAPVPALEERRGEHGPVSTLPGGQRGADGRWDGDPPLPCRRLRLPDRHGARGEARLTLSTLADYFDTLPQRDKVYLALRFYDDLPIARVADILGAVKRTTSNNLANIVTRWRNNARNLYTDHQVYIPPRRFLGWEPPQTLVDYVRTRHRNTIPEYLGRVSIALHNDHAYLGHILNAGYIAPGSFDDRPGAVVSPCIARQIDRMLAEGVSRMEISRLLGLNYTTVTYHVAHRRAASSGTE